MHFQAEPGTENTGDGHKPHADTLSAHTTSNDRYGTLRKHNAFATISTAAPVITKHSQSYGAVVKVDSNTPVTEFW